MNGPFSSNAQFRAWLAYKGTTTGWDGSLVAGSDSDIPMPIVAAGGVPSEFIITTSGGIVFSGASPITRDRIVATAGGVTFSGSAAITFTGVNEYEITPSGGIVFGGTAPYEARATNRVIPVSGGVVFDGTAAMTFGATNDYVLLPSGGIVFGGAAPISRNRTIGVSGGVTFGGTAPYETHNSTRTLSVSGGISFGGTAPMTYTSGIAPERPTNAVKNISKRVFGHAGFEYWRESLQQPMAIA